MRSRARNGCGRGTARRISRSSSSIRAAGSARGSGTTSTCSTGASRRATRCACSAASSSFANELQVDVRTLEPADDVDPAAMAPAMRRDADELEGFLEFLVGEITTTRFAASSTRVLDTETRGMRSYAGDARTATTRTRAGCSSTRSASRRSAARRHSCTSGCAPTCCSPRARPRRRAHTGARTRPPSSARPTRGGCSATCTSGCALIEERAPLDRRARRAAACRLVPSRRSQRAHGRGGGALPREPARRRRGDETRQRLTGIAAGPRREPFLGRRATSSVRA